MLAIAVSTFAPFVCGWAIVINITKIKHEAQLFIPFALWCFGTLFAVAVMRQSVGKERVISIVSASINGISAVVFIIFYALLFVLAAKMGGK